jgi:hypothetical protein
MSWRIGRSGRIEHMFDSDSEEAPAAGSPAADDGWVDEVELEGTLDDLSTMVAAAIDGLAADDPAGLGFSDQRRRLRAIGGLIDRLEAQRCRLTGTADRSGALADHGAPTAASWLRRYTTLTASQAADRARIARRLPQLPVIAAAFAAGRLGVAHMVQIDRLCADVGVDQVTAVQHEIITAAQAMRFISDFAKVCAGWRYALRPDLADRDDDRAYANRRVNLAATFDGTFHLSGLLDSEGGATLAAAINAYMHRDPPGTPHDLRRNIAQRRADALVDIARVALAAEDAPDVAGARPTVVVRVDLADLLNHPSHPNHHHTPGHPNSSCTHTHDHGHGHAAGSPPTLEWGGPIGPAMLERLLSDCSIARVVFNGASQPLDVGTATRVWPAAIRRAITERDRGCRFDPCDRPAAWCDIDHADPWTDHGPTAVHNGLLLCRHHHRAKRRDGWWPTLHPDGTVTWTHPDGRTRTDPPPHTQTTHHTRTLLHTLNTTHHTRRAPPHAA